MSDNTDIVYISRARYNNFLFVNMMLRLQNVHLIIPPIIAPAPAPIPQVGIEAMPAPANAPKPAHPMIPAAQRPQSSHCCLTKDLKLLFAIRYRIIVLFFI